MGAAAFLALVAVAVLARRGDVSPAGPLHDIRNIESRTMTSVDVGPYEPVSIGIYVPLDTGAGDVRLTGVELLGVLGNPKTVGALASWGRGDSFVCVGAGRGFPPDGCHASPVEDWTVTDEAKTHGVFQVVVGVETGREPSGFAGLAINYQDAGKEAFAIVLQGGFLCPRSASEDVCRQASHQLKNLQDELAREWG